MRFLRNIKIGNKITILISIAVIALFVVGISGYKNMNTMAQKSNDMYQDHLYPILWWGKIATNTRAIDQYTLELMLTTDPSLNKSLKDGISQKIQANNDLYNAYKKTNLTREETNLLNEYEENISKLRTSRQKALDLALQNKNTEAYSLYVNIVKPDRQAVETTIDKLVTINQNVAKELNKQNQSDSKNASIFLLIIILASITLCITVGILITKIIVNPVKDIQNLMKQAEEGDFTVQGNYQSKDEIGILTNSFNHMINGVREMIHNITFTSQQVAASAEELAASAEESSAANDEMSRTIQELSAGSEEQARGTEETSRIVNEIAVSVNQVAISAKSVTSTALQASNKSSEGTRVIETSINQMNNINVNVTQLSDVIKSLGNRSKEISNITKVISDIASQTNLLALNAAIEAARAGENGKGFAVVADEVRKLAEQSSQSSQQISELIFAIQEETTVAVKSMEETAKEVSDGISLVGTAGESFKLIQNAIQDVSNQVEEVSVAMEQMSVGAEQVIEAINKVSEIAEESAAGSQTVAASAEELAASSEEVTSSSTNLANIAEELQTTISKFKI
jgi:methyl-accepting chemotaxis protein